MSSNRNQTSMSNQRQLSIADTDRMSLSQHPFVVERLMNKNSIENCFPFAKGPLLSGNTRFEDNECSKRNTLQADVTTLNHRSAFAQISLNSVERDRISLRQHPAIIERLYHDGGTVDTSINNGGGPYIYRLNGQNHHVFGALIPDDDYTPEFCQLYIYDTENKLANRMRWIDVKEGDRINEEIVEGLMQMLDENNELVQKFRIARDRYEESIVVELRIILKVYRSESGRETHVGPFDEVAAIMVGDLEDLLFPSGEDGYHKDIKYNREEDDEEKKREYCTMKDFYSYKFQVRHNEGRLFQQYVVDSFSIIEQSRLWWFKTHQTILRNELYHHICDYLQIGDGDSSKIGKSFILPAGFVGSKCYMQQNFQDVLVIYHYVGHPDLFLTITCKSMWDEIQQMMKLIPGGTPQNNRDIIARVFRLKLNQLLDDIKKKKSFLENALEKATIFIAVMYVAEFQKRGLPHVHMLIWLDIASKINLKSNVDKYVSAEIPNPLLDLVGYAAVKAFMIHGPCGVEYPNSPYIVPAQCLMNSVFPFTCVEKQVCYHARSLKYLFKYCLKGHDRATVEIKGKGQKKKVQNDGTVNEIQAFFDGRYICGCEASYRIFGFDIHHQSIVVERLSFHLPGQKNCTFRANESLEKVASRAQLNNSKLEAFFLLNQRDENARQFTYDEIPRHYIWNDAQMTWTVRKKGLVIGRLVYTHHSTGEIWFLRLLLSKIRGPTSFESLRIMNGVLYPSFKDACKEHGFLDNDSEWHEVIAECSKCGFAPQIRELFVHIIVNCKVNDLNSLWSTHFRSMSDEILFQKCLKAGKPDLNLTEEHINFFALAEIDSLLKSVGKTLKNYPQIPQPPSMYI
ncbi:uncharacterized protein LOC141665621 [Apium graveolens]|uniref:uncharacterized protein LOC141665621 n=1 Tax=Apium graveolens TaxID=4045 RepID=UPI003D7AC009